VRPPELGIVTVEDGKVDLPQPAMTGANYIYIRVGLRFTGLKMGIERTIGRVIRLGTNLIIQCHMCRAVPFRTVSYGSDMWCTMHRLLLPEDVRLVVVVVEGLALEEAVDALNFELEVVDALLDVDVTPCAARS
jgi:hypothetical protein